MFVIIPLYCPIFANITSRYPLLRSAVRSLLTLYRLITLFSTVFIVAFAVVFTVYSSGLGLLD